MDSELKRQITESRKFISQLFEEHQTQQERIAEERNKTIIKAARLLLIGLLILTLCSCTTRLQQSPPPDCEHIEHDGDPTNCNLFGNDNCYFEWAYEHGVPMGEDEDCGPYSEKHKGRCYPI